MKKILVFTLFLLSFTGFSQAVEYFHDANGNRTQRKLVVNPINNNRMFTDSTRHDPDEGTMKMAMNYGVSVYPNPTQSNVNLSMYKIPDDQNVEVVLFDNSGKVLQKLKNPKHQEELQLQDYRQGIYYLSISINEKDKLFYKIVKQ